MADTAGLPLRKARTVVLRPSGWTGIRTAGLSAAKMREIARFSQPPGT